MSVLVPVLNEERHLAAVVEAMRAQRFDGELEFLFIDGGSQDGTRPALEALAREDPRIRILDNPARVTPAALNVGLRHARGRFIVRMDAHTLYPRDYIARGIERLERGDVDWVSGPQIPAGEGRWSRRVALALGSRLGTGASRKWGADESAGEPARPELELDTGVFGGVWRRATIDRHGGWDEGFPINQDSELAARVLKSGGRIVSIPTMGARYVPRDNLGALAQQYLRYGFYRARTSRRHPESVRRSLLLMPGLVLAALASVAGPRPLAGAARVGLAAYGGAVLAESAQAAAPGRRRDAAALPAVFVTMHLAWGTGFLAGCLRFGPPLRAALRVAGLGSLVERRR